MKTLAATNDTATDTAGPMKAIVQYRYGSADVLEFDDGVDHPTVGPDEVVLEVHAAGVDRGVWHLMTGEPYLVRLAGYGLRAPKNPVLGLEVAGRVVAVGNEVTRFVVGDRVFGLGNGAYAEYATATQDKLAAIPADVSYERAAIAPSSGSTALQALTDVGHLEAGQKVLVVGAAGGVGTFAVQLAKAIGGEVTAIAGAGSEELLHSLGADRVIDYTQHDFVDDAERYDLIIDIGGRNSVRRLRSVLARKGTLVIVGGEDGNRLTGGIGRQVRAVLLSPFIRQRLTMFIAKEHYEPLEHLAAYLADGSVIPVVAKRFPLAGVPDALRELVDTGFHGKAVIAVR